jgi:hypothetical protein
MYELLINFFNNYYFTQIIIYLQHIIHIKQPL